MAESILSILSLSVAFSTELYMVERTLYSVIQHWCTTYERARLIDRSEKREACLRQKQDWEWHALNINSLQPSSPTNESLVHRSGTSKPAKRRQYSTWKDLSTIHVSQRESDITVTCVPCYVPVSHCSILHNSRVLQKLRAHQWLASTLDKLLSLFQSLSKEKIVQRWTPTIRKPQRSKHGPRHENWWRSGVYSATWHVARMYLL